MKVICSSARACPFRECSHRTVHGTEGDTYSCTVLPCEIDIKPKVDIPIVCIQVVEIKR